MKPVVGIFAHPDDEAFFTGGTMATLSKEHDVFTICVTNGDAGENNSDKTGSIADIRKEELEASAKILGIKKTYFLDYKDGTLSNSVYHEIAAKIQDILDEIQPEIVITFEPRGISGHLDHVAVSLITSYVFERVSCVKELWYFCNTNDPINIIKDYFIYWPPGYKKDEISKVINTEPVWDQKVAAMKQHVSQRKDVDNILAQYPPKPKEENFIILSR
ncbi:MAG TPA: PIG-L family deacetylase [Candidatus Acidoferrales bacterium]|nr:PIG-L family deacetylase [Candidatus Acidoferrales bacterium]